MSRETVVILGAGQAGARVAEALRADGCGARVMLVGEEDAPPYERPPLSKDALTGEDPPPAIGGGEAHWRGLDVELVPGTRIVALDRAAKALRTACQPAIHYDRLVIATGSRARVLEFPRASVPVLTLRTVKDSRALREALAPGRTVLLAGGGVIGLEAAASAVARGCRAVVAEAGPWLMGRCAPSPLGERLLALHRARGVEVLLGAAVRDVEGRVATLSNGTRVEADVVLVGIGAVPNDELAAEAGLAARDGVIVDGHGRTDDPAIFAVGEVARHPLPRFGIEAFRQESWRHAEMHPRAVARAMLDAAAPAYDDVPGFWSDQHGERLMVEGLPGRGVTEVLRGGDTARPVTFHLDAEGRVVGAATLGDSRAMAVARRLIGARPDVARLDVARLADAGTDLRGLLK